MFIKFSPQSLDPRFQEVIKYKKIDENTISVNGEELYFNPDFVEYNVENIKEIQKAYRDLETNELYLELLYRYPAEEKSIWENPNYYNDGGYRGTQFEDFTDLENGGEII
jgi:hypothetical protein